MYLVLIETTGNQHYIFATNKLRENVGASELTYQIGTKYVLQAVEQETKQKIWVDNDNDGRQLRANLLNQTINPPIEDKDTQIEVIIATSGKAVLLVKEKPIAEKIVSEVTKKALIEMPGLTVHGAIETVVDKLTNIHEAVGEVHRKLETLRHKIPSNQQRFLRLPHVEPCATSGLPASEIKKYKEDNEAKRFSSLSYVKRETRNKGYKRIRELLAGFNLIYPENIEECSWTAVIHADGNGLGQIFLEFNQYAGFDDKGNWTSRKYLNDYRAFSLALDVCTINAAKKALAEMKKKRDEQIKDKLEDSIKKYKWNFSQSKKRKKEGKKDEASKLYKQARELLHKARKLKKLPVVPLVLGGDDLTVLCDGQFALKFTHDFLAEFEKQTSENETIWEMANNAFGNKDKNNPSIKRLGICAGIAIVKPHYPFHQAYELAEQLLKSAKQVKAKVLQPDGKQLPCSAMDFHVLYDSSGVELKQIREKLVVDEGKTYLYAKPYIVTQTSDLEKADNDNKDWFTPRTWNELEARVCAMSAKDDDNKNKLPNSQLHHIRESLQRGKAETDSEINLFSHRYANKEIDKDFDKLLGKKDEPKSLFFDEKHNKDGVDIDGYTTHFLDALDVVEFWKGFDDCKKNGGK